MRIRTSLAVGAAVLSTGLACAIDDKSAEVFVEVTAAAPVVVRGDKVALTARARRVVTPAETVDVQNIRFAWTTSSPSLATIVGDDFSGAELTGVNAGSVEVRATAVAFEASQVGTFPMRVSNLLEVDSVRPSFVKWGEKVKVYGVGVRNIFIADLTAPLFPDTLTFQGDPQGFGVMEFWVPPPARTDSLFVLGPGIFFTVPEVTAVDTVDLYEFNDTIPSLINLDAAPPYPTLPQVLFFNPALSFEEPPRDTAGPIGTAATRFDWYRFNRNDVSRPFSIVLKPQGTSDSTGLFLVLGDSIMHSSQHIPGTPSWFMTSQGGNHCPAGTLFPDQARSDSLVIAMRRRTLYSPSHTGVHLLAFYQLRQRYAVSIVDQYIQSHPAIGPDRFEENDLCTFADSNAQVPALQIDLHPATAPVFQDSSLTIDNPHEMDWFRFRITQQVAGDNTMIRIRSRLLPGTVIDRSDIDFYVLRVTPFGQIAAVSAPGSRDSTRLVLTSGEYYLAVFDYAGEATKYSLCISVRFPCVPLVNAVEAGATENAVRAAARGPERARTDGQTKTGWARTREWARPAATAPGQSPFKP